VVRGHLAAIERNVRLVTPGATTVAIEVVSVGT